MAPPKSDRPRSARRRLRNDIARLEENIMHDIELAYEKPVEEWDWEELSKGRPRGKDGQFRGNKPKWITPAIQAEAKRRMRSLTEDELMTHAVDAINVLKDLMTDNEIDDFGKPTTPSSVKLDAAKYILNHVIGTPKARVEIESSNPLQELMGQVLVNPDGEPSHMVVMGEVVEDDDDDGGE